MQVSRRIGTVIDSTGAEYTAAIRKGLAVIADFADRRLEDWTGSGFRSVDDLRAQLDEMERHWEWLSRDLERFRWDVIRVQLPHAAVADAYPDWVTFREAVVALAREQVRAADYDVNSDDVIDAAWVIVSSGSNPCRLPLAEPAAPAAPASSSTARRAAAFRPAQRATSTTSWAIASGCQTCTAPSAH